MRGVQHALLANGAAEGQQFRSRMQSGLTVTVEPLSSFFTATSSPVAVSRISCATPKLPLPKSRTCLKHG